ncbi:MAG: nucleotidyltransferase domain-containing protein [Cyanobium sp. LacPavin_0818_WC50_MAG_67_9]|nr:nucleotidyltransferase domain-containing protein [Cyanobium sp. LacPavin_0818_WC50_MAG_67_9]
MPVRSLTQSVLRWPQPEKVLHEVRAWSDEQGRLRPSLRRVGLFGSYGRGTASVGSDLDLLLVAGASAAQL